MADAILDLEDQTLGVEVGGRRVDRTGRDGQLLGHGLVRRPRAPLGLRVPGAQERTGQLSGRGDARVTVDVCGHLGLDPGRGAMLRATGAPREIAPEVKIVDLRSTSTLGT